jgi:peptidoglycan hydrolase CwlO-like protein
VAFSIGANLISSYYAQSHRPNDDTQATIDKTIRALQDNAGQAMQLIEDLQNQITARTKAIQEAESRISDLNKQRAVLQLSGVLVAGYRQRHITKRNPINSGAA